MKLLNFAVSYMHKWIEIFCLPLFLWQTCHVFYLSFFDSLFPHAQRWDLKQKHFCWFFIVPICSQKFILDSPFHIYKDIPEGQAMSDSFWSIMSNIPHMRFLPLEEKKQKNKTKKILRNSVAYCNLETEPCKHWVKSSLFRSYFVTNESGKEPWRTEEHCLFVFERAFLRYRGEARW